MLDDADDGDRRVKGGLPRRPANNLGGYLRHKAAKLGLERQDKLAEIQTYLDKLYPGQCRAISLNDGVLKVVVNSSSLASELRMRQIEVEARFNIKIRISGTI